MLFSHKTIIDNIYITGNTVFMSFISYNSYLLKSKSNIHNMYQRKTPNLFHSSFFRTKNMNKGKKIGTRQIDVTMRRSTITMKRSTVTMKRSTRYTDLDSRNPDTRLDTTSS